MYVTYGKVKGHLPNVDMAIIEKKQVATAYSHWRIGLQPLHGQGKELPLQNVLYWYFILGPHSALEFFLSEGAGVTASCLANISKLEASWEGVPVTFATRMGWMRQYYAVFAPLVLWTRTLVTLYIAASPVQFISIEISGIFGERSEPHTNHENGNSDIYIYASTRPIEINACGA